MKDSFTHSVCLDQDLRIYLVISCLIPGVDLSTIHGKFIATGKRAHILFKVLAKFTWEYI